MTAVTAARYVPITLKLSCVAIGSDCNEMSMAPDTLLGNLRTVCISKCEVTTHSGQLTQVRLERTSLILVYYR